jgi:hypothetical protein
MTMTLLCCHATGDWSEKQTGPSWPDFWRPGQELNQATKRWELMLADGCDCRTAVYGEQANDERHGHLRHQGLQASCSVQQCQTYRFGPGTT